jgi:two-component system, NarL family, response regulator LiaR
MIIRSTRCSPRARSALEVDRPHQTVSYRAARGSTDAEARHTELIRVLVVDDHDLFRTGLSSLLSSQPDMEVVAQASGGRMALRLANELRPDVVLMDLRMPDLDGPAATRAILQENPAIRVVVLTAMAEDAAVAVAIHAGACGFLAKDTPIDDVVAAVRAAASGAAWLAPRAAEVVLGRIREGEVAQGTEPTLLETLSPRELSVLRLLARGMDNNGIADSLNMSPRTVKNHVSSILAKLGVPNRIHAAIYALRGGIG